MDEEAPGLDRLQPFERGGDPVALRDAVEHEAGGGFGAHAAGDEVAHIVLVRLVGEEDLDQPGDIGGPARVVALFLEGSGGDFRGVEHLDDDVRDGPRSGLVGAEPHHMGGVVGGHSFEHEAA